jgi:hypothetical protein
MGSDELKQELSGRLGPFLARLSAELIDVLSFPASTEGRIGDFWANPRPAPSALLIRLRGGPGRCGPRRLSRTPLDGSNPKVLFVRPSKG